MRVLLLGISPVTVHLGKKFIDLEARVTFCNHSFESIESLYKHPLLRDYSNCLDELDTCKEKVSFIPRREVLSLQKSKIPTNWGDQRFLDDFVIYWKESSESEMIQKSNFDLVIDGEWFFTDDEQVKLNGNDYLLGEESLKRRILTPLSFISQESEILEEWSKHSASIVVSVGRDDWSNLIHSYLLDQESLQKNINWVSSKEYEFKNNWESSFINTNYEARKKAYHSKVEDYEKLEDYEKVKVRKPKMEEDRLKLFNQHNIVSVNQFEDANDLIVNIEDLKSDEFKCLSVCDVLNFRPYQNKLIFGENLNSPCLASDIPSSSEISEGKYEKGLISFGHNEGIFIEYWDNLAHADRVFDLAVSYFSKRDEN